MFETLLTSSVLILALCVIRLARGKISARLIYALWLIAPLRFLSCRRVYLMHKTISRTVPRP